MALLTLKRSNDSEGVNDLCAEFEFLRKSNAERINRMHLYRMENDQARQSNMLQKIQQPDVRDYGRAARGRTEVFRHEIPLPFGKALSVKHAYRISGQLPDVIVDRRDESPEERYRSDTMEKIVWAIMRASRGQTQFSSGAFDGSQLGTTCFDLYFDVKTQMPIFRAVDPANLMIVPGIDDPHQFQRVYKSWDVPLSALRMEYKDKMTTDDQGGPIPVRFNDITHSDLSGTTGLVTVCMMTDGQRRTTFVPHCNVKLEEYTHNYGFVPYVAIPNIGPDRDVWGWADYEFTRAITAYMSVMFSREADILRAVANGTYLDRGTGQNPETIRAALGEGGVLPSKKDGTLEPVNPPQIPAFAESHSANAMQMFKMLGFAPDASWGLGRYTSGSEHGLSLQPFVEFTAMKQLNWEAGLGRMFGMAFQMLESKLTGTATYRGAAPAAHGTRRLPFSFKLGSNLEPDIQPNPNYAGADDPAGDINEDEFMELPRTPKELFDGDYEVRFVWNNRLDPDDPSFITGELNKFQHGAQSLETTLERLGFQAPQDEIKRIEKEAELYPWLNEGMIALIKQQIGSSQGQGGGQPSDPTQDLGDASQMLQQQGPSAGPDAGTTALGPNATGPLYGGA